MTDVSIAEAIEALSQAINKSAANDPAVAKRVAEITVQQSIEAHGKEEGLVIVAELIKNAWC